MLTVRETADALVYEIILMENRKVHISIQGTYLGLYFIFSLNPF